LTNRDYQRALLARKLQKTIGRPSTQQLIRIVGDGLLPNCPVDVRDIKIADEIFGPDLGSLKGKTTRRAGEHVESRRLMTVLNHVMEHYRDITLAADIMFMSSTPFFITISRNIKFGTVEVIQNNKSTTIMTAVEPVRQIYLRRGSTRSSFYGWQI
jgi:hypothetical protein